jgi:TPP-dependent pyruvate/acetoin dehydrogenase alpha subunit
MTAKAQTGTLANDRYGRLFREALLIRLVEEKVIELYPTDRIQSPVHLSIGQEAVSVGVCEALRKTDILFSTYRGHAYYISKGGELGELMAELYGRVRGFAKGKAGSMHLAAPKVGMMGSSAVVGSTISHAVGSAMASRFRGNDQLSATVFGDGATEQGSYHEALNFASLYQLPVLFICENNGLAVHSPCNERQAYNILNHVGAYGIETVRIKEGWDFIKIGDVMGQIADAMRKDGKPRFVEVDTCRYKEHVGPGEDFHFGYRGAEAVNAWKAKDPLILDKESVARFTPEIVKEIQAAVDFAEASPVPGREELVTDVY